jgi:hypothetical protein
MRLDVCVCEKRCKKEEWEWNEDPRSKSPSDQIETEIRSGVEVVVGKSWGRLFGGRYL